MIDIHVNNSKNVDNNGLIWLWATLIGAAECNLTIMH
jgi:hypothetical protein